MSEQLQETTEFFLNNHSFTEKTKEATLNNIHQTFLALKKISAALSNYKATLYYNETDLTEQTFHNDVTWHDFLEYIQDIDVDFLYYLGELQDKSKKIYAKKIPGHKYAIKNIPTSDVHIFLHCYYSSIYILSLNVLSFDQHYIIAEPSKKSKKSIKILNTSNVSTAELHIKNAEKVIEKIVREYQLPRNGRIYLYLNDHPPPHGHILGPDCCAKIDFYAPHEIFGNCPQALKTCALGYVRAHAQTLMDNWNKLHPREN